MKICVLPLDSRPCSYDFIEILSKIGGIECILPPMDIMDYFRKPSDFSKISNWLSTVDCDTLILPIDQLLYGGLLASRQSGITLQEALERLKTLEDIKRENPNLRIFASNVLMRTTVSTLSLESTVWWDAVSRYAKLTHLIALDEKDSKLKELLKEVEAEIPTNVLGEFLAVRERNHEINKACIELVASEIIDFLLILQEDCTEFGMHRAEQKRLLELIEKHNLQNKVVLHNGTDEATTELLARAVSPTSAPVQIKWLGKNPEFIALFEDRPFADNLKSHLNIANLREDEVSDVILFIYLPKSGQKDFCTIDAEIPASGYTAEELMSFVKSVADAVAMGKKCYLLDVAYANGGDPELLKTLAKFIDISELYGYSAWNTASNATGTILSQIVLSSGENSEKNKVFTYSRILDDVIYQAIIRKRLNQKLIEKGLDPYNISDLEVAKALLQAECEAVKPLVEQLMPDVIGNFEFSLRWPRTFEIEAFCKPNL